MSEDGASKEIFLDEIEIDVTQSRPTILPGPEHGTVIEIRDLNGAWAWRMIKHLSRDVSHLTDPVTRIAHHEAENRLEIAIYCNGEPQTAVEADSVETLKALIEDKAVLKIRGRFDSVKDVWYFRTGIDGSEREIGLGDAQVTGLWVWRRRFGRARAGGTHQLALPVASQRAVGVEDRTDRKTGGFSCGSFAFHFHIFDFSRGIDGRYSLKQVEKNLIKGHRIYLYRTECGCIPTAIPMTTGSPLT